MLVGLDGREGRGSDWRMVRSLMTFFMIVVAVVVVVVDVEDDDKGGGGGEVLRLMR
jgi:hypothetical protein